VERPAWITRTAAVAALATTSCLLWGSAYPAIKSGYALLGIERSDTAAQLVFAGWRFLGAGALLLALGAATGRKLRPTGLRDVRGLVALGLFQTALQYLFFYIGLAHTSGVKGAILNATGTFFSVLLAHVIYHDDRLRPARAYACVIGFAGVVVVNLGAGFDAGFTLLGEGFVILAAFTLSAASIYGKRLSQRMDALVMTGHQLALGGVVLLACGYGAGGSIVIADVRSAAVLAYLVLLSAVAFALWSVLLKHNRVSRVAVFTFLIPVFGALLSALFMREPILEARYLAALVLVSLGVWMAAREPR
jgi:drug/metabolite transporter (DMT)-like permease